MGYYTGKNAIVTGAASGIGLGLCEELLEQGANKIVMADYNADNLATQALRLSKLYPRRILATQCNVTQESDVCNMIEGANSFFGGVVDLLINCAGSSFAGIFTEAPNLDGLKSLEEDYVVQSNEKWHAAFALNFYGALYGCRAVLPYMLAQKNGQIINIISGIAFMPMAYQSMYAATKAALNAMTLSLRTEYWDAGIKFNSATPGTTATAIWKKKENIPAGALTPRQSAQHILAGAEQNQRLILGDEGDKEGAEGAFSPSKAQAIDEYLLKVARTRRQGRWAI